MSDEEDYSNLIDYDPDESPRPSKGRAGSDDDEYGDLGSDGDYSALVNDDDDYGGYDLGSDGDLDPNDFMDDDGFGEASGGEDAELENMFLEAKDAASDADDVKSVLSSFEAVLDAEEKQGEKGTWGFRSLKWLIKLNFKLGDHPTVKKHFQRLLKDYGDLLVEKEKAVKKMLEALEESPDAAELFRATLDRLESGGNKKAALRLELIQARVLARQREWEQLAPILERLHDSCRNPDGEDDPSKGSQLLEIYALKIQRENALGNDAQLKQFYQKALALNGLANPRVTGVIHECGGKSHLREAKYKEANTDFIEAFKNFDEGGAGKDATACLKYLVLANLLSGSDINPFDDNRAKAYSASAEIQAMQALVAAVQAHQLVEFERVLKSHPQAIGGDPFLASYLPSLRRELQKRVFLDLSKPYSNVQLPFVEKRLQLDQEEAEALLVEMILDGEVAGVIDQVKRVFYLHRVEYGIDTFFWGEIFFAHVVSGENARRYESTRKWASSIQTISTAIFNTSN